jgi:CRISPR/Cas system-associated exonuclease Cas4 (RecB family)
VCFESCMHGSAGGVGKRASVPRPAPTQLEEETGVAPPYGVIVLGSGERVTVQNTPELREWVLGVAEQIRAARRYLGREIAVRQPAAKCRACGMREGCGQRAG